MIHELLSVAKIIILNSDELSGTKTETHFRLNDASVEAATTIAELPNDDRALALLDQANRRFTPKLVSMPDGDQSQAYRRYLTALTSEPVEVVEQDGVKGLVEIAQVHLQTAVALLPIIRRAANIHPDLNWNLLTNETAAIFQEELGKLKKRFE